MNDIVAHPEFNFTPREMVAALRRYRVRGGIAFIAVLIIGGTLYTITPIAYESQAAIVVHFGRESVYLPEIGSESTPIVPTAPDHGEAVNTQMQLFQSRDAIIATIKAVGLNRLYPGLGDTESERAIDHAVRKFERALKVNRARDSEVVQISFRHPDPNIAPVVLKELLEQQRRLSAAVHGGADLMFYDTSVEQARNRLKSDQTRLTAFQAENGVLAFDQELPLLLHQRQDLLAAHRDVDSTLAGLNFRLQELERTHDTISPDVIAYEDTEQSRAVEDARSRLLTLRIREQDLLSRFPETSSPVQQARREIAETQQFLQQSAERFVGTVRRARNPILADIESDIQRSKVDRTTAQGRINELASQIAQVDLDIKRFTSSRATRSILESELNADEQNLRNLQARREETRLASQLSQLAPYALAQTPTVPVPGKPAQPDLIRYTLLSIITGLIAAITTIAGSAMFDARRPRRRSYP